MRKKRLTIILLFLIITASQLTFSSALSLNVNADNLARFKAAAEDSAPKPFSQLADGEITTIAGKHFFVGDGGPAINAPVGAFKTLVDNMGAIFIADLGHSRVRKV